MFQNPNTVAERSLLAGPNSGIRFSVFCSSCQLVGVISVDVRDLVVDAIASRRSLALFLLTMNFVAQVEEHLRDLGAEARKKHPGKSTRLNFKLQVKKSF